MSPAVDENGVAKKMLPYEKQKDLIYNLVQERHQESSLPNIVEFLSQ
jgi:hypothetical protein